MAAYVCVPVLTLLCVGECARVSGHTLVQPRGRWKVKTTSVWNCHIPYRIAHTLTLKEALLLLLDIVDLYREEWYI